MFKLPSFALFQHLNVDVYELFKKLFYFGNHYCDSKLALQTKVLFCQMAKWNPPFRLFPRAFPLFKIHSSYAHPVLTAWFLLMMMHTY